MMLALCGRKGRENPTGSDSHISKFRIQLSELKFITFYGVELGVVRIGHAARLRLVCADFFVETRHKKVKFSSVFTHTAYTIQAEF